MKLFLALFTLLVSLNSHAQSHINYQLEVNPQLKQQVEVAYIESIHEEKIKPIYLRIENQDSVNKTQVGIWGKGLTCEMLENQVIKPKQCVIHDNISHKDYQAQEPKTDMPEFTLIDLGYINIKQLKKQKSFQSKLELKNGTFHVYTFDLKSLKF